VKFLAAIFGCALGAHFVTAQQAGEDFRIAGYLPEYRVDAVDPSQVAGLTDLIAFSVSPRSDGSLDTKNWPNGKLDKARNLATKAKARLLLAVGGWGRSAGFPGMAGNAQYRQRFVKDLSSFCQTNGFKGVVYDWEFPQTPKEEISFDHLLRETRRLFVPKRWTMEVAVNSTRPFPRDWTVKVGAVHVMSYDNGPRHATYEQAVMDLNKMALLGVPAKMQLLGLPFYGRQITNRNNILTYAEIKQRFRPKNDQDEAGGFYFNGPDSLAKKVKLAKERGLGGVMIWEIGQDAKGKDSLLKQVVAATRN
jgi:GH18 family chitinase